MAQIVITIPDSRVQRVVDAVARRHGWTTASGVTKAEFAKKVLIDIILGVVVAEEGEQAAEAARAAAEQKARAEIVIS